MCAEIISLMGVTNIPFKYYVPKYLSNLRSFNVLITYKYCIRKLYESKLYLSLNYLCDENSKFNSDN